MRKAAKLSIMVAIGAAALLSATPAALAETQTVDGVKIVCEDGVCRMVDDSAVPSADGGIKPSLIAQGYMEPGEFIAFLRNASGKEKGRDEAPWSGLWAAVLAAILGGLAMNLTPCVLPMIPVNLMVIGRSAARGALYALGILVSYGTMGALAVAGGRAFGELQGSPWFNAGVSAVFAALALALAGAFHIDFSRARGGLSRKMPGVLPGLFAFLMGVMGAVLAGACVAPVLVGVLLLAAKMQSEGNAAAFALPFAFGFGMALPWPFLGAGLRILPKPGAWMKGVNAVFAAAVAVLAVRYGMLAWKGFSGADSADGETPATIEARLASPATARPVLVDCWATWCGNCKAMEGVLADPRVKAELEGFTVIRLQAEDIGELRRVPGFGDIRGLPAFVLFE